MNPLLKRSVTLLELIICLVLIGMVIIGFYSIETFSRYHLVSSDKRAKVQNEASFVLEHMAKNIPLAIGDINNYPVDLNTSTNTLRIWIDSNQNGLLDWQNDTWVSYEYLPAQHQLRYCANTSYSGSFPNQVASGCSSGWETLTRYLISNISSTYLVFNNTSNFINVSFTACWDTSKSSTCGRPDNPTVTINSTIRLPSISIR